MCFKRIQGWNLFFSRTHLKWKLKKRWMCFLLLIHPPGGAVSCRNYRAQEPFDGKRLRIDMKCNFKTFRSWEFGQKCHNRNENTTGNVFFFFFFAHIYFYFCSPLLSWGTLTAHSILSPSLLSLIVGSRKPQTPWGRSILQLTPALTSLYWTHPEKKRSSRRCALVEVQKCTENLSFF